MAFVVKGLYEVDVHCTVGILTVLRLMNAPELAFDGLGGVEYFQGLQSRFYAATDIAKPVLTLESPRLRIIKRRAFCYPSYCLFDAFYSRTNRRFAITQVRSERKKV